MRAFGGSIIRNQTAIRPSDLERGRREVRDRQRDQESVRGQPVGEGGQQAADHRAGRQCGGLGRPASRDATSDVRLGVGGAHGVDVPRLERAALQRPRDPAEGHHNPELHDVGGDRHAEQRRDVQDPGQDQRASPAQDVGEAARGQLEHDDHDGVHGEQPADDRQLDAPRPQLEDEDRDDQADRQPLQAAQDDVAPFGLSCAEQRALRGHHRSRSSSRSNGKTWR